MYMLHTQDQCDVIQLPIFTRSLYLKLLCINYIREGVLLV